MKTILLATIAALLPVAVLPAEEAAPPAFFPFVKGRFWLYDGKVTYAANGKVNEKDIKGWRSEVVEVAKGADFQAALLKGRPSDLAWFEDGRERSDAIVIVTAKAEYEEYDGDGAVQQFASIKADGKLPADMKPELIFRYPPKDGERFGEEDPATNGRYCWVASATSKAAFHPPVKGLPKSKPFPQFTITYRSSPDHTIISFAAEVGITGYTYVHHGTKGDCEMRLVETGIAKPKPEAQPAADKPAAPEGPEKAATPEGKPSRG